MSWVDTLILAVVQGLSEFLPISSSGHLVVVTELLGGEPSADVNIVLHAGTLFSILVYFRKRILALLRQPRVVWLLVVGSIPAAALGFWVKSSRGDLLESGLLTGFMLIGTGLILLAMKRYDGSGIPYEELQARRSLGVGFFQALALLPGISRSGSTILGGLWAGLDRASAATFSFLLAIPTIAGASLLEIVDLVGGEGTTVAPHVLLVGCAVAFVVGLAALHWLFRWVESGRLHLFAYWCIPVGLGVVLWQWSAGL